MPKQFVFDTNSLISAALTPQSTNRRALDKALQLGELAISEAGLDELTEVLFRKKFDRYFLHDEERWTIVRKIEQGSAVYVPTIQITDCRDPKDNKFLELAVTAQADCLITGDADLLVLHPFRLIPILNAGDFLTVF